MHRASGSSVFARPQTPAAKCLHLIRQGRVRTRPELIRTTGLSQPTITRAVTALVDAGLVRTRPDLAFSEGPGRPTTPVEPAGLPAVFIGAAVGTSSTYIGLYDPDGRRLRETDMRLRAAEVSEAGFVDSLIAAADRLTTGVDQPVAALGVTTSGRVTDRGVVDAPNLGWHEVDLRSRLRQHFPGPVTVSAAVPAILGSETQSADLPAAGSHAPVTLAVFADDSVSAAVTHDTGVTQLDALPGVAGVMPEQALSTHGFFASAAAAGLPVRSLADAVSRAAGQPRLRALLDERARALGEMTGTLATRHRPATVVLAGSALTDDPQAPRVFARAVRQVVGNDVELRMIPGHREIVLAIARAVALDEFLREPLGVAESVALTRAERRENSAAAPGGGWFSRGAGTAAPGL